MAQRSSSSVLSYRKNPVLNLMHFAGMPRPISGFTLSHLNRHLHYLHHLMATPKRHALCKLNRDFNLGCTGFFRSYLIGLSAYLASKSMFFLDFVGNGYNFGPLSIPFCTIGSCFFQLLGKLLTISKKGLICDCSIKHFEYLVIISG